MGTYTTVQKSGVGTFFDVFERNFRITLQNSITI